MDVKDRPVFNGGDFHRYPVYWLYEDSSPGLRMTSADAAPVSGYPEKTSFDATVHFEKNDFFYCIYHLRPDGDLWFWGPVLSASTSARDIHSCASPPRGRERVCTVDALMASFTDGTHTLQATLNGASPSSGPDPATWTGKALATFDWTFDGPPSPAGNALSLTIPASAEITRFRTTST